LNSTKEGEKMRIGALGFFIPLLFATTLFGTVILAANPTRVVVNDTTSVHITVLDSSDHPVSDGTPVELTSRMGICEPETGYTASAAVEMIVVYNCEIGYDTLVATTAGFGTDTVVVEVISASPDSIVFIDESDTIYMIVLDTHSVVVQVLDSCGNPVADGTVVNFAVEPSHMGDVWIVGVTSSGGYCRTMLQAGTTPGLAHLIARASAATSSIPIVVRESGIHDLSDARPSSFHIAVLPNPFNSSCIISLSCHSQASSCHSRESGNPEGWVEVEICDLRGNVVMSSSVFPIKSGSRLLPEEEGQNPLPLGEGRSDGSLSGVRAVVWTPDNSIPSGIYLVRATTADGSRAVKRIAYLK